MQTFCTLVSEMEQILYFSLLNEAGDFTLEQKLAYLHTATTRCLHYIVEWLDDS